MKHSFDEHDGKVPNPSETKLVETAHEVAAYLESYAADGWQQVPNAGTLMHRLATELEQSATALASLADELRLARERVAGLEKELREADEAAKDWWRAASPYATPGALREALGELLLVQQIVSTLKEPR